MMNEPHDRESGRLLPEHVRGGGETVELRCQQGWKRPFITRDRCDSNAVALRHLECHAQVAALPVLFPVLLLSLVLAADDNDDRPTAHPLPTTPPALVSLFGDASYEQLLQPGPTYAAALWGLSPVRRPCRLSLHGFGFSPSTAARPVARIFSPEWLLSCFTYRQFSAPRAG